MESIMGSISQEDCRMNWPSDLPTPDFTKRKDRGGVYYFRYYHPIVKPDGTKGYIRPNISTGTKDKEEAEKFALEHIREAMKAKDAPFSKHTQAPPPKPQVAPRTISGQGSKFIDVQMRFLSISYKRATVRAIDFLTTFVRANKGQGEPRDLIEDICPESLNEAMTAMNKAREASGEDPYTPKYWAEILNDWSRFLEWECRQEGTPLKRNYASPEDIPRPDKKKFGKRKVIWAEKEELAPFLKHAKEHDPKLYELAMVVRYSSMDPADYFDFQPHEHMIQTEDGEWYIEKERAKEPGQFYRVPIDKKHLLELFLKAREECQPGERGFTKKYQPHQRESWGTAISWRRKRLWEKLFPGKPVKTFKDLRRTFSDYWQRKGIPTPVVQIWMGHSEGSAITTTHYSDWTHTADLMKAKA
jgi:integrase